MKYTFLALITLILFSSCTLTQRRYESGYSVNWKHSAPKTIAAKEPVIASNTIEPIAIKELNTIATPAVKWTLPGVKQVTVSHTKNIATNHIASVSKEPVIISSPPKQEIKGQPQFFTGDEQEDDYARKSLVDGLLSLGMPAIAFLIMFGIVLSIGGTLATAPVYAIGIMVLGCALGLVFGVSAIINGFHAIKEINAQPDTYTGKGEAITGMALSLILPLAIVAYFLIRFL